MTQRSLTITLCSQLSLIWPLLEGNRVPKLSVIVPTYNVQSYIRKCLDSVLRQSFTNFEVIAINDCSPDASGDILDEYARNDSRVRVLHLTENLGVGRARDLGTRTASGEYLLFLDGDDTYLPGALEAIAAKLEESGNPDLLVFDHVRTYWWGKVTPSASQELLASGEDYAFTLRERPEMAHLFAVVWNKAFRTRFWQESELIHFQGPYEDAPISYKAMMTAKTMICLNHPCVEYRQRRSGSATVSPSRKHFDIFAQYASIYAYIEQRPELDDLRDVIFPRMINHFLFCLERTSRVRPTDRRVYFRRSKELYRNFRPAHVRYPNRWRRIEFHLVDLGLYSPYTAFKTVQRARRRAKSTYKKARRAAGALVHALYYRLLRYLPIDEKLAVYSSYWNRGPSCNPAAVQKKAEELVPDLRHTWVIRRADVDQLPTGIDHVLPNSWRYWWVMARAKYFVNNVNFANEIVKRPGQLHLQTHHGTPVKVMGVDQQDHPAAGNGMSFRSLLKRIDRWDLSLTSNEHSHEMWGAAYPSDYENVRSGYPRNDIYYHATARDVLDARERLGLCPDERAVLYAPTVRDYRKDFAHTLDLRRFADELGGEFTLLVRSHYFYGQDPHLQELEEHGLIRDVSEHASVEELCLASDALITDYSSIMFDYANLNRPIVIHAPDWETYTNARGVYFDLISGRPGDTPGAVARDDDELIKAMSSGEWCSEEAHALRAAFRERFCQFDDGRAAERAVRRTFLDERELPEFVPMAERTVAPTPEEARTVLLDDKTQ